MVVTNRAILLFICHLLSWRRSQAVNTETLLAKLYKSNDTLSLSQSSNITTGINFSEGGEIKTNLPSKNVTIETVVSPKQAAGNDSIIDLLDGAPGIGSSSVKARKGVSMTSVVPRKGAPPCIDAENAPENKTGVVICPPAPLTEEDMSQENPSPLKEDSSKEFLNSSSTIVPKTHSTTTSRPFKPTITIVPADSDEILKTLKSERNVVIPVAALVCAPLIVLLVLFVYKRCQSRGDQYYERMGFLIEDIYND